jgi:hypothetical protein
MTNNARLAEVKRAYRLMVMNGMKCELSANSGHHFRYSWRRSGPWSFIIGEVSNGKDSRRGGQTDAEWRFERQIDLPFYMLL